MAQYRWLQAAAQLKKLGNKIRDVILLFDCKKPINQVLRSGHTIRSIICMS
jgi:hypothetical protein